MRVSERKIHDFVKLNEQWVLSATDKIKKHKQQIKSLVPEKYDHGVAIPFKGEQRQIQLHSISSKRIKVIFDNQVFMLYIPVSIVDEDKHALIRLALIEWMKNKAAEEVQKMVDNYAQKYNLYPRFVRIKTQKSRWGSCGIHNDINLNWLLILAPEKVMEYVVIHELCHIKERNHSARFWNLVEKHCPSYKEHRLWLKQNGRSIMQGL